MKRWTTLAACALALAACADRAQPVATPVDQPGRSSLLSVALAPLDAELSRLVSSATATDRLQVIINLDETLTSSAALGSRVLGTGAGVVTFRNLPMVAAVATPGQIALIRALPGVRSVYANSRLQYMLAESNRTIRSDLVWADGYTGKGVGIAILDSGVDGLYSPGLQYPAKTIANVKYLADLGDIVDLGVSAPAPAGALFINNVPNSETSTGHGTHVAGIAGGDGGGSSAGIYRGVAPGANIIGIGAGDILFVFWTLAGFDYILDHHEEYNIQVVNNSWGTTGAYDPEHPIVRASRKLYDRGITVVFAAGNEGPGENTLNPYSAAPWVISVAAGCKTISPDPTSSAAECNDGRSNILADFSSRGIAGDPLVHPDITAPGVNIVSTRAAMGAVMNGLDLPSDAQTCNVSVQHFAYYTCASGTSMASPHIAGVVALMEEASRGRLTPSQALAALTNTARPLPGYAQWEVGAGYVDALAAVRAVRR
jgi:serine protease AprX